MRSGDMFVKYFCSRGAQCSEPVIGTIQSAVSGSETISNGFARRPSALRVKITSFCTLSPAVKVVDAAPPETIGMFYLLV